MREIEETLHKMGNIMLNKLYNYFMDTPFVHLIDTPYGFYFFDVNTHTINKVEKNVYNALELVLTGEIDLIDENSMIAIERIKSQGLLKSNRPKSMKHPASDFLDYYLKHRVNQISLQITQDCNFRCNYCVYSENNNPLNRRHSKKKMSFDLAKKAVDFLLSHSRDVTSPVIAFYGGEPLLEFGLLKKTVLYAEEAFLGKPIRFDITTNCSLIDRDKMNFFVEHNIPLLISLDGPKDIHDANRKFAANGCGTFDVIMSKLHFIKENYPDYYKQNNIKFSIVIDPSKDLDCVNEMFIKNSVLQDTYALTGLIDDSYSTEKNEYSDEFVLQSKYEDFIGILNSTERIKDSSISLTTLNQLRELKKLDAKLGYFRIKDEMSHAGPCIVGSTRLLMNAYGDFYPCEKVSELSPIMNIGNIEYGFDIDKVKNLMNVCKISEKECINCWAINECSLCPKFADGHTCLDVNILLSKCNGVKKLVEDDIRTYIAIKEIKASGCI